jgi:hypothetical protein
MGYGMQLIGAGALAGSALAVAIARYVSSELPGVQPADPTLALGRRDTDCRRNFGLCRARLASISFESCRSAQRKLGITLGGNGRVRNEPSAAGSNLVTQSSDLVIVCSTESAVLSRDPTASTDLFAARKTIVAIHTTRPEASPKARLHLERFAH